MKQEWQKLDDGIRARLHPTRKHGLRPDLYFVLRFSVDGVKQQEALGWASQGWTLTKARFELAKLKEAIKTGDGATSLREKRLIAKAKKEAELKTSEEQKKRNITASEYWHIYQNYIRQTLKPSSFRSEEGHMRLWILPFFGDMPLVDIDLIHWDKLIKAMSDKCLSQRTKEYCAGTLRRMLNHAADRGLPVTIPPSRKIGAQAPQNNSRQRVLTKYETESILKELHDYDYATYLLTKFCMLTGCRLSEATSLKWHNVNFESNTVTFVNTKNKDHRTIYIADDLVEMLKTIGADKLKHVFLDKNGKEFIRDSAHSEAPLAFRTVVERLNLNAGRDRLDRISFHTIRHTAATNLAKVLDVRALMDVMGWKVIAMAARYVHTQEDAKRKAANTLAGILN